jgi:hypothetical protein
MIAARGLDADPPGCGRGFTIAAVGWRLRKTSDAR